MKKNLNQKLINLIEYYNLTNINLLLSENSLVRNLSDSDSSTSKTQLEKLNYDEQKNEYEKCLSSISRILVKPKNEIRYMSHPCGSYNHDTLKILKELGIELGFKQIMSIEPEKGMKKVNNSFLEIAREDHAEIFKRMNK